MGCLVATSIILTNGVSFSLVNGLVCVVNFSQAPSANSTNSSEITLNINSTGSKYLRLNGKSMKGNGNLYPNSGSIIVAYNGSYYNFTGHRDNYSDDT